MAIGCVVLDFDGTFTDVEQEAAPFGEAFVKNLSDLLGGTLDPSAWTQAQAEVQAQPQRYGWMWGDKVVAPGVADPYILSTASANRVLDARGVLKDTELRTAVVSALYRTSYQHTRTAFRPHAKEVLAQVLQKGLPVYVVSNAETGTVQKKLRTLGVPVEDAGQEPPRGAVRLFGDARKFAVEATPTPDAAWNALPESIDLGIGRPIWVQRGNYYRVLREIWRQTGKTPAETFVAGDIYELDLALPQALGCQVHLVTRASTPLYEQKKAHTAGEDLRELLKYV
jgi:FMN phosphatase YigB (HAD superfamily)